MVTFDEAIRHPKRSNGSSARISQPQTWLTMPACCGNQTHLGAIQRQAKEANNTGIPDGLKQRIEQLSGYSMADVRVHYSSDKPAAMGAAAYVMGSQIYLGPGHEDLLAHELAHVLQKKMGLVTGSHRNSEGMLINDEDALEAQADLWARMYMGSAGLRKLTDLAPLSLKEQAIYDEIVQFGWFTDLIKVAAKSAFWTVVAGISYCVKGFLEADLSEKPSEDDLKRIMNCGVGAGWLGMLVDALALFTNALAPYGYLDTEHDQAKLKKKTILDPLADTAGQASVMATFGMDAANAFGLGSASLRNILGMVSELANTVKAFLRLIKLMYTGDCSKMSVVILDLAAGIIGSCTFGISAFTKLKGTQWGALAELIVRFLRYLISMCGTAKTYCCCCRNSSSKESETSETELPDRELSDSHLDTQQPDTDQNQPTIPTTLTDTSI